MTKATGDGLECPACGQDGSGVTNSRVYNGTIHRRRQCRSCGHRYSTVETHFRPGDAETIAHLQERVAKLTKAVAAFLDDESPKG